VGPVEVVRKKIASDLVADIRGLDARLKANEKAMATLIKESGSTLTRTVGIGNITAARLIGRTGPPGRFPNSAAYAAYTGVAPIEVASADKIHHRLSRSGDRQLNSALHTIAITQIRTAGSLGDIYYQTKIAEGKSPREARRCLKPPGRPCLADHDRRRETPPSKDFQLSAGFSRLTLKAWKLGTTPSVLIFPRSWLPSPSAAAGSFPQSRRGQCGAPGAGSSGHAGGSPEDERH
jgi:hypothetical protein